MSKAKTVFAIIGLAALLGITIFVTQYAIRQQLKASKNVLTSGDIMGYTFFNESCTVCSPGCDPLGYHYCYCQDYLYTGGITVNYTTSYANVHKDCQSDVKVPTACGNSISQALSAVKDIYPVDGNVNGYSDSDSNECNFVLSISNNLGVIILSGFCWAIFMTLIIIFLCKCCDCCCGCCCGCCRNNESKDVTSVYAQRYINGYEKV